MCKSLIMDIFSFVLSKYLGMEFLDHRDKCMILRSYQFYELVVQFDTPISDV